MKLIITLILILVIIGIILIAFFCIRKKVRDTSQALFGTPDITQAAVQMKQEILALRPANRIIGPGL